MKSLFKLLKYKIFFIFCIFFFISCSSHKYILSDGNDFQSLISKLVEESSIKIKKNLASDDIVLVSDFVNLDKLKNKSKLGFLLSDLLKDSLVKENIIVRQMELSKEFTIGKKGFNLLNRNINKILSKYVSKEVYGVVGTYSITNKSLNTFIKLIDIRTGYIYASSYERIAIDDEILELEETKIEEEPFVPQVIL